jgi:dsRNA-specific ribonuclease
MASAEGSTKKEAEQKAARSALERLQQPAITSTEQVRPNAG